ncbi:MAG TPA: ABC-F family ATP-binding cassette domain-containing protein, partial [Acidimicrobiales bacterium]|nr:ABC-F family ATP-binding cassette domain-containing protein [Acidimicrobiales bacterium]
KTTSRPVSLVARAVSKHRGAAVVLDSVTVSVDAGSRLGVVGPNGVGKTTLLKILAGLDAPDGGLVSRVPAWSTVGYLPQEADRRPGETLLAHLARRTGVAEATELLERAAVALGAGDADPVVAVALGETSAEACYEAALDRYLSLGGPDFEARAEEVCSDLGLPLRTLELEMTGLSGGQAARASLASVLLSRFDVLLLDEPTNDLDFAGLDRLEEFLGQARGGVVIVSHDRAFLERTITSVLEIDEHTRGATEYAGGWLAYLEARATARRHASEAFESYQSERRALLTRAREQRQWAVSGVSREKKNPRDNDKAQRDFRINRTENLASKVRITEKHLERLEREKVDKPFEGWDLRMTLPVAPHSSEVAAYVREGVIIRGTWSIGPIDLEVRAGDRLAVRGPNGSGKSSLIHAMLGRLPLASGEAGLGPSTVVGELDQARRRLEREEPLVVSFGRASGLLPEQTRSLLAKFGLTSSHVERAAATLSPGERTRSELALLMACQTNCLVLDEPTNHLDLPAIEELEQALETYNGTLILVTHDRRLLEAVEIDREISLESAE